MEEREEFTLLGNSLGKETGRTAIGEKKNGGRKGGGNLALRSLLVIEDTRCWGPTDRVVIADYPSERFGR